MLSLRYRQPAPTSCLPLPKTPEKRGQGAGTPQVAPSRQPAGWPPLPRPEIWCRRAGETTVPAPPRGIPVPHARSHRRAAALASLLAAGSVGCATWQPFGPSPQASHDQEAYGPTADQRSARLVAEAKAARAAGPAGQAEFTQRLVSEMLGEHDPQVRRRILGVAADFDTPTAVAICKGALQDPDPEVRMEACAVWAKRGGPEAVSLLTARVTTDSELDVRLRALRMLGELGDERAIPVLAKALEDPDPAVQYRAVAALKKVSGRDLGDDVNKWREWAADPEGGPAWSVAEGLRRIF